MHSLIEMEWLQQHLDDPNLLIIDCRFQLGHPTSGKDGYLQEHIPGAHYLDLEKDLSGSIGSHGGRHPLPDPQDLAHRLGELGVNKQKHIIIYDNQGGSMASRCWWLLQYLGHPKVSVLNGSFHHWKQAGFPVTHELPQKSPCTFVPQLNEQILIRMEELKRKLSDPDLKLIDSREYQRYIGEMEPIDPVAGHIPGAIHSFWKKVLNEDGFWKNPEELQSLFAHLPRDEEIIVYCGSGVTATPNVLALKEAGFSNVKLYAGSWSDWISDPNNPIARGEE
ncbi:sulfurtransferase [Hazenella coriacea]|uniref:Thiosulfate/3-mercaptopyruvate sulfurtransferase n=1 Tax=Hazenella coriacea TaxID=1179467 RepID=A0A4R3L756_9BACL|nr:sulfurtransferase [Hazenella coriacea]TCS94928.1 thiosulfate/3-mercaptopyruvate sulfurtransferase [Hazenella coriacea]